MLFYESLFFNVLVEILLERASVLNVNLTNLVIALMITATIGVIYFLHVSKQTQTIESSQTIPNKAISPTTTPPFNSQGHTILEKNEPASQEIEQSAAVLKEMTQQVNRIDICLELNSTMRGFSGPNDRMKIFKEYGYAPSVAVTYDAVMGSAWRALDKLKEMEDAGIGRGTSDCFVLNSLQCEEFMEGVDKDIAGEVVAKVQTRVFKNCPTLASLMQLGSG